MVYPVHHPPAPHSYRACHQFHYQTKQHRTKCNPIIQWLASARHSPRCWAETKTPLSLTARSHSLGQFRNQALIHKSITQFFTGKTKVQTNFQKTNCPNIFLKGWGLSSLGFQATDTPVTTTQFKSHPRHVTKGPQPSSIICSQEQVAVVCRPLLLKNVHGGRQPAPPSTMAGAGGVAQTKLVST